mmetsp:Transcript_119766/g.346170  ORF Transcript_119766/g.346170 Transcript_119766/m.346170 type:complete len:257 (-) Transcript_119766:403-1173(-)
MAQAADVVDQRLVPHLGLRIGGERAHKPQDPPPQRGVRRDRAVGALLLDLLVVPSAVELNLVVITGRSLAGIDIVEALHKHQVAVRVCEPHLLGVRSRGCIVKQLPGNALLLLEPPHSGNLLSDQRRERPMSRLRSGAEEGQPTGPDAGDLPRSPMRCLRAGVDDLVVHDKRQPLGVNLDVLPHSYLELRALGTQEADGPVGTMDLEVVLKLRALGRGRVDFRRRWPPPCGLRRWPERRAVHLIGHGAVVQDTLPV